MSPLPEAEKLFRGWSKENAWRTGVLSPLLTPEEAFENFSRPVS